jgi:hypothetical protein
MHGIKPWSDPVLVRCSLFCAFELRLLARPFASLMLAAAVFALAPLTATAGGPRYVAGTNYFDPGVLGQPAHWANGQVSYYVDQGPLNGAVTHEQATAMVDAAASLWSAVRTAGVTLTDKGTLNEDVNGLNTIAGARGQFAQPTDLAPAATGYPLAIVFDSDGSVIDSLYGTGSSEPTSCQNNGVFTELDNINPDATIAHATIILNGRCATSPNLLQMMSFEVERALGSILGLGYSQVNHDALQIRMPGGTDGWPIMQPLSGTCGSSGGAFGGSCIPNPTILRYDDIAALNRIYPITTANLSRFPGKMLTAANTVSIRGVIAFRTGSGMQGVNVVARPLDANGNPIYQFTVSAVSGALFSGNRGNPVTGLADASGVPRARWGSNDTDLQGTFDIGGIPLPPGVSTASYQITFEAIDPLFILGNLVGPYGDGQVSPSGTLSPITVRDLNAGSTQTVNVKVADSAAGGYQDAIGTEAAPRPMPASGMWVGRLGEIGQSDWFSLPVRGNRTFTIVTQATDETGGPTGMKALPSLGVWDGFSPIGATAVATAPGLNGSAVGETWLRVSASADDIVRIGIADLRGDGRPDYSYNGWVLYAATVQPARLPASGGPIVIHGMGFRANDTVLVGGRAATVTSISPNEITAIAPAAAAGVSGSVDLEVDDLPVFYAQTIIAGGLSYDSGSGDALSLVTAPANTVPTNIPLAFTVAALGADLVPAGNVTVTYAVTSGSATLACGLPICHAATTGDGIATMNVVAVDANPSVVTASLSNGSNLQAHFTGGTPPTIRALTPQLSLAAGTMFTWTVQALALSNGIPSAGQTIVWQPTGSGITVSGSASAQTNSNGIAVKLLSAGPLTEGQTASINACVNGTSQCVTYTAFGARPQYAALQPVSGVSQHLAAGATPGPIVLRLLDMNGNAMVGGTVALYQALYAWTPACNPHVVCTPGVLLGVQSATAASGIDGLVTFTPATMPGVATYLQAVAITGNSAVLSVAIEQHP